MEDDRRVSEIDMRDLNAEFCRIPGDIDYYGELYAKASGKLQKIKIELKREEAKSFLVHKNTGSGSRPGTAPSDKVCEQVALQDRDVIQLQDQYVEASIETEKLKNTMEALKTKRDMLIQLGASERKTREYNPVIRDKESYEL